MYSLYEEDALVSVHVHVHVGLIDVYVIQGKI